MKTLFIMILSLAAFVFAQSDPGMKTNEFVKKAGSGDMKEVQLGNLALQNATSQGVKDFGRTLAKDHSKAVDDLKEIAKNNNIKFPDKLDEKDQAKVQEFQQTNKSDFDKKFVQYMIKDHKKDIQDFTKAAKNNKNKDVREWAEKNLPVLKKHLDIAQKLSNNMK